MRNILHKSLFSIVLMAAGANAYAYDFAADGIYYNITSADNKTVAVTASPSDALYSGTITIPATVTNSGVTYTVASLEKNSFSKCKGVTSVIIADSDVELTTESTSSGEGAFYDCSLDSIYVGRNVTYSVYSPVRYSETLRVAEIGDKVTALSASFFFVCQKLEKVKLGKNITSIGQSAFTSSGIKSIEIPDNITTIGESAFSYSASLETVKLPANLTSMSTKMFQGCKSLKEVNIPSVVKFINDMVFYGCTSLENINIPESVVSIGVGVFQDCSSLKSISLHDNISSIETSGLFNGCKSLESVKLPSNLKKLGSDMFRRCSKLATVEIPESVAEIGQGAFRDCSSLSSIKIPESVTSLSYHTFKGCSSLKSITLPANIQKLTGQSIFEEAGITEIHAQSTTPPTITYTNVFDSEHYTGATLYVPEASLEAYKAANGWKNFTNIKAENSGVESNVADEAVKVVAQNGEISIVGADENAVAEVYNVNGQLVYNGSANVAVAASKGFYIVKVAGKAVKVAL